MNARFLMLRYPLALLVLSFVLVAVMEPEPGGSPLISILALISVLWGGALIIYKVIKYFTAPVPAGGGGSPSNANNITINVNSDQIKPAPANESESETEAKPDRLAKREGSK